MRIVGYVLTLGLWLLAASAVAQSNVELAKRYYLLGEELYNQSDYRAALEQIEKSYRLSGRPPLLHNIARCHESLGEHEKAIQYYEEYLKSSLRDDSTVRARIRNLRSLLEQRATRPPVEQQRAVNAPQEVPRSESRPGDGGTRWMPLTGWSLVAVGGALLATGIALGVLASSKATEFEEANRDQKDYSQYKEVEQQGQRCEKASIATLVIGGVSAAGGALFLILDRGARQAEKQVWLTPSVGPGSAAILGGVRF